MILRDHPLLSHRGVRSWPPAWHWLGDGLNRYPKGEVGILKEVRTPVMPPFNRCFLVIEYKNARYMGCLFMDDIAFCTSVSRFLESRCGERIEEIGSLDISHTL
jgi:hypothetical protein